MVDVDAAMEEYRIQRLSGDALRRMKRSYENGTGCRLSAEEIRALSVTLVGEWWGNLNEYGSSSL